MHYWPDESGLATLYSESGLTKLMNSKTEYSNIRFGPTQKYSLTKIGRGTK